ncbi:MAG TPA: hypothetical protein VH062_26105 [Polyangiaceae bacterium]|jgi:hypothetical protein|nr:hypothetical protein [Polyangiaceae bacterium]
MNTTKNMLACGATALCFALACGGSTPAADTPTNENAVPSDANSTQAPPPSDPSMGGAPATGPASPNDVTTPPDGYAGSPGPGSSNTKPEKKPRDSNPTVAPQPT